MKKIILSLLLLLININIFAQDSNPKFDFQVKKQVIDTIKGVLKEESYVRFLIEEISPKNSWRNIRITIGNEVIIETVIIKQAISELQKLGDNLIIKSYNTIYRGNDIGVSFLDFFNVRDIIYFSSPSLQDKQPDWRLELTALQMRDVLSFINEISDYNNEYTESLGLFVDSDIDNLSLLLDKMLQKYDPNEKYKKVLDEVKSEDIKINSYKSYFSSTDKENINIRYSGVFLTYFGVYKNKNKISHYVYGFNLGHVKYDFLADRFIARLLEDLKAIGCEWYYHKPKYREERFGIPGNNTYEEYVLTRNNNIVTVRLEHEDRYYFNCNVVLTVYTQNITKEQREKLLKTKL